MIFTIDTTGIDRVQERLRKLTGEQFESQIPTLMASWQDVIRTDNRDGILAGLDKDGNPIQAVTYRPVADKGKRINARGRSDAAVRMRHGQAGNRTKNLVFAGTGPHAAGLHNNLTSSEYRKLDGPPLAPRYQFSRVISNLRTDAAQWYKDEASSVNRWVAFAYWDEVVARDGVTKFLVYHFDGEPLGRGGPSIVRDLRGVRPDGMRRAQDVLRAWTEDLLRYFGAR